MDKKEISKSVVNYECAVSKRTERVELEITKITKKSSRIANAILPPFIFKQPVDCSGIEDCGVKIREGYYWEKCPAFQEWKNR